MKRWWMIALLIVCICGSSVSGGAEKRGERSLTLMVYMCGSNLESEYGSATMDLMEMQAAGFDEERLTVLAMTGGAERWALGGNAEKTVIRRIRPGGQQIVWQSDACDMGDPDTLRQMLTFGRREYPADDYALILWDHGGGPLEGVCWDELFAMDGLTLDELTKGILAAGYPDKLSWIGFDACLMSTAEVASALAPCAEVMIASQETEPAAGWNYAFLKDADGDGRKTGRLIVDSYFDALADLEDPLSMACVDLTQMGPLVAEMDTFFAEVDDALAPDTFQDLSRIRHMSFSFGEGVRAVGIEGYDLVDLKDLITRYGKDDASLREALEKAVICSRSSEGNACGLSVYHPYVNKLRYEESWRDGYHSLDFSTGYIRYTEHFGAILTGQEYVDWSGMTTVNRGAEDGGTYTFSLALTEEQQNECLSAELMIMESIWGDENRLPLAPVSVMPADLDENGVLSAAYGGEALYVLDENGGILTGPVSFLRTEDGEYCLVLATYYDDSARAVKQPTSVLYYCSAERDTGEVTIERQYVYDRVSRTFTNRIPFSEDGFTDVNFRYFLRYLPDTGKSIYGFGEWESFDGYVEKNLTLPCKWHLGFLNSWNTGDAYALFQITDSHQNTWCSVPVRMDNPEEIGIPVSCELTGTDDIAVECSAVLKKTTLYPALILNAELRNTSDRAVNIQSSGLVVNGTRSVMKSLSAWNLEPGAGEGSAIYLQDNDLAGIDRVDTVDFIVQVTASGDWQAEPVRIPIHLELKNAYVRDIVPAAPPVLDEYTGDDVTWQLIGMEHDPDGTLSGMIHVINHRQEGFVIEGVPPYGSWGILLVNGVQTAGYESEFSVRLAPETDAYVPFTMTNSDHISRFALKIAGDHRTVIMGLGQALEQAGYSTADLVELYEVERDPSTSGWTSRKLCTLRMPEGTELPEADPIPSAVLMEEAGITVSLERVLIADDGIGLGLRLNNDTDRTARLELLDPAVNGEPCEETYLSNKFSNDYNPVMPPHTRAVRCVSLALTEDAIAKGRVRELTFTIVVEGMMSGEVTISLPDAEFGAEGGTYLSADQLTVVPSEPVLFEDKPAAIGETIALNGDHVYQVRAVAPISEAQAAQVDYGNVSLCLLSWRQTDDEKGLMMPVHIVLSATGLQRDEYGWSAVLSGFTAMVQDYFIRVDETKLDSNEWKLKPASVYFYCEEGSFNPTGQLLLFDGGVSMYSTAEATVRIEDDTAVIVDSSVSLNGWLRSVDRRYKVCLDEIADAAVENRVFFGTDRIRYAGTLDYSDAHRLDLSETISICLVPAESIPGEKCLSFSIFYLDGSREDVLTSLDGGTVLDRTFTEAKTE